MWAFDSTPDGTNLLLPLYPPGYPPYFPLPAGPDLYVDLGQWGMEMHETTDQPAVHSTKLCLQSLDLLLEVSDLLIFLFDFGIS